MSQGAGVFLLKGQLIKYSRLSPGPTVPARLLQATTCSYIAQTFIERLFCLEGLPNQWGRKTARGGGHSPLCLAPSRVATPSTRPAAAQDPAYPAGPPCRADCRQPRTQPGRLCAPGETLKSNMGGGVCESGRTESGEGREMARSAQSSGILRVQNRMVWGRHLGRRLPRHALGTAPAGPRRDPEGGGAGSP